MTMRTIVPAEGAILERILETTYPSRHDGLSRHAFANYDTALRSTPWALHHEPFETLESVCISPTESVDQASSITAHPSLGRRALT